MIGGINAPAASEPPALSHAHPKPSPHASGTSNVVASDARRECLAALARHHDIKREIVPLIAAWRDAGIETLLYKGFFLAEFVYPSPGSRFHGDVDVLIRAQHAHEALRIARAAGWHQRWHPRRTGAPDGGALFDLYRPDGAAQLDVHQLLVPAARWWKRRQRRITEAVWSRSEVRTWEGTGVRLPAAADAIVVNLALERAVADGAVGLKPADATDLALLLERGALTTEDLHQRARELGCPRTLTEFLALSARATVAAPTRASRLASLRWRLAGAWESGYVHVPTLVLRLARAPALVWDIARALPVLIRVRRALRSHRDVRAVLANLTPAAPVPRRSARARWRTVRAIHWAHRLLPLGGCLPQALAIYAALRAQGWKVEFVSGVRRDPAGLHGHAWVEEDGGLLRELLGWERLPDYQGNFRYPSPG